MGRLIRWTDRHARLIATVYLCVVPLSILVIAALGAAEHYHSRSQNRHAIILLARANCTAAAVFEQAALSSADSADARVTIRGFFKKYTAPINEALMSLGATPCKLTKGRS